MLTYFANDYGHLHAAVEPCTVGLGGFMTLLPTDYAFMRARQLAKKTTKSERLLRDELRRYRELDDFAFQNAAGPYIPDFISHKHRLLVEVDGSIHDTPKQVAHDQKRDEFFVDAGYRTLRIRNREVKKSPHQCVLRIAEAIGVPLGEPRPPLEPRDRPQMGRRSKKRHNQKPQSAESLAVQKLRVLLRKKRKKWTRQ